MKKPARIVLRVSRVSHNCFSHSLQLAIMLCEKWALPNFLIPEVEASKLTCDPSILLRKHFLESNRETHYLIKNLEESIVLGTT